MISDSCPVGLVRYTGFGTAWRLKVNRLSPIYGDHIANNMLEFLGLVITFWLILLDYKEQNLKDKLILALADSTSAICWVYQTILTTNQGYYEPVNFIACKVATLVSGSGNFLESQHILGDKNEAANYLMFEGDECVDLEGRVKQNPIAYDCPSNDELSHRFHSVFPQLIPENFRISHLPSEILSFANQGVQILKSSMMRKRKDKQNCTTEFGGDGNSIAEQYSVG